MRSFKIGDVLIPNNLILAPMAGVTNYAFRKICKEYNCGLCVTEMVSDKALMHSNQKTIDMTDIKDESHPISIQLFGGDKESLIGAAKYLEKNTKCDIIDINMGCPVNKIANKSKAGSSLLKDPDLVYDILKSLCESVKIPVTVKIRIGWDHDSINAVKIAKLAEKAGCKAITVHGRTRSDFYSNTIKYDVIKKVKESVNIPVIGNGDITDINSFKKMLETGVDAVMIGRGALGNPFIFKEINSYLDNVEYSKPSKKLIYDTIIKHYNLLKEIKSEKLALLEMRSHISWYIKNLENATSIRKEINTLPDFESVNNLLINYLLK